MKNFEDKNKLLLENFQNYYLDELDQTYSQRIYEALYVFSVSKEIGGDRTQVANEIRSIPNVTTVATKGKAVDQGASYRAIYSIKFALEGGEGQKNFLQYILNPSLKKIRGLSIVELKNIQQIK